MQGFLRVYYDPKVYPNYAKKEKCNQEIESAESKYSIIEKS